MITREMKIKALVMKDIECNGGDGDWFLKTLLYDGHAGYNSYTDAQLNEGLLDADFFAVTGEERIDRDEVEKLANKFDKGE